MPNIFTQARAKRQLRTCFSLGKPEAEAELAGSPNLTIKQLFVDDMKIMEAITSNRFIITGRKGTGKSAVVGYVRLNSYPYNDSLFTATIKPNFSGKNILDDVDILDKHIVYYQWLIISQLVKLILETRQMPYVPEVEALSRFAKKYINLFDVDRINSSGWTLDQLSLSVNLLKSKFGAAFAKKDMRNDSNPQPFYTFIPSLLEVLKSVLNMDALADYEFKILFDDLDIDFKLTDPEHCRQLLSLIRVAKELNTDPEFSKRAQIVLFIRDDVERKLCPAGPDPNKMFGSYEFPIKWYEGPDFDEYNLLLRKFINRRIESNFKIRGKSYYERDPWQSYVRDDEQGNSVFKNLLDYTFYRPRDLINIFLPLEDADYTLPLSKEILRSLIKRFSDTLYRDLEAELSAVYSIEELRVVKNVLSVIARKTSVTYNEIRNLASVQLSNDIVDNLYEYGMIGAIEPNGDHHFHFRSSYPAVPMEQCTFILPKILRLHFDKSQWITL